MIGFALGIAAALSWSALDVVRKAVAGKASPEALAVFLLLGQLPFFAAWALYDQTWISDAGYWAPALVSMSANALANVLFMRSVHLSPLSRTVPFLSLTPVFGAVVAIPLLGEVPGETHWAGILLVILGAMVLNSDLGDSWWRSLAEEKGAPYMIAVAVLWACTTAFDKRALGHAAPASHSFLLCAGSSTILLTWMVAKGRQGELREVVAIRKGLLAGLIGFAVAALALQMLALQWLWVAVVETLKRAVGVVGSVVFGRVFFGESITSRKLAAIGLMVVGTALLALT